MHRTNLDCALCVRVFSLWFSLWYALSTVSVVRSLWYGLCGTVSLHKRRPFPWREKVFWARRTDRLCVCVCCPILSIQARSQIPSEGTSLLFQLPSFLSSYSKCIRLAASARCGLCVHSSVCVDPHCVDRRIRKEPQGFADWPCFCKHNRSAVVDK